MGLEDSSEIPFNEPHPASRSAYRWLKGFMVTNHIEYSQYKLALEIAAEDGNQQANYCVGTINRLKYGEPVSDRYLLGLCWTILHMHNHEAMEAVAQQRIDRAYPKLPEEL